MSIWFTARGAGLSALILLTITTCLGALMSRQAHAGHRYVAQYVHRAAAGLGLTVLVLHITTILIDSYAHVGLVGAFIPFTSGYRPTTVALGTLAGYTFIAVAVLGLARGRMAASPRGAKVWRGLHGLGYVGWGTAILHGYTTGTDSHLGWVRLIYLGCLLAVVGSFTYRVAWLPRQEGGDRFAGRPAPAALSLVHSSAHSVPDESIRTPLRNGASR